MDTGLEIRISEPGAILQEAVPGLCFYTQIRDRPRHNEQLYGHTFVPVISRPGTDLVLAQLDNWCHYLKVVEWITLYIPY